MRDVVADNGLLFLGSRFKRLADRLLGEAATIIRDAGLPIQPAHFPVLAAIEANGAMTVGELGGALRISQPAVTRSVARLVELGLLAASRPDGDLRQKTLALTGAGRGVLIRGKALVWPRVTAAVEGLTGGLTGSLVEQLTGLEAGLDSASLRQRVARVVPAEGLTLHDYSDDLAPAFAAINAEWIEAMFVLEENDRKILSDPRGTIVDKGGVILFVEAAGLGIVGTCALMKAADGVFELTKMGVSERARGRKAGEYLLAATLARAAEMDIETLYLLTNSKCAAAIHLYEKLGFRHDAAIMAEYGRRYDRCNVAMAIRR